MSGHLRMGAISTELGETIPYVLATLRSACPKLHLQVVPGTSQQLYEGLNLGTLDLAVTVRPDFALPKSRNVTVLKKQKHMLLTPRGMKGSLEEILEKHPFIRYDARSWGGEKLESYLRTLRIDRNILCDIDSLETIAVMVGNGMGVSVVPEWSGIDLHKFRLNKVQMAQEAGSREICVIHNLPAKLPKVIELITEICQTHASKTDT
ncbi:LysR substrate-binding domain-containing protein [Antarctobacter sp.]|uniref:LysR substrate-binding domain-containing protein n=1 Tax=Antarctobacter sp. TaxID=1872577 RepID=UPI002B264DA5|nr:LysR substrate-binding domain-containing protein [Antarctobacter sp.]